MTHCEYAKHACIGINQATKASEKLQLKLINQFENEWNHRIPNEKWSAMHAPERKLLFWNSTSKKRAVAASQSRYIAVDRIHTSTSTVQDSVGN